MPYRYGGGTVRVLGGTLLRLHAVDVSGPARWAWRLLDEAGRVLHFHEVRLDPAAPEYQAFDDLYRYLRRNAAPDDRVAAETAIVDRIGAWAGAHVLGPQIGRALADARPVTVPVVLPPEAEFLLTRPLELSYVDGVSLARLGISLVHVLSPAPPGPATAEAGRTRGSHSGLARGLVDRLGLAVLAMRYPVMDSFATALTRELYSRLLGRDRQKRARIACDASYHAGRVHHADHR